MGLIPNLSDLLSPIKDLVSEAVVDKDKRDEINYKIRVLEDQADARIHEQLIAQTEVNKTEAVHRSVFVAGWRPYIGWGCGTALIYNTLIAPMFGLGQADLPFLQTILMGMLGLSVSRTFEKVKGVSNDVLRPKAPAPVPIPTPAAPAPKPKKKVLGIPLDPPW